LKKSHGVQLLIRAVVRDPDGKVLSDTGRKPAKSFVLQFLEFIYAMGARAFYQATGVAGTEVYLYAPTTACIEQFEIDGGVNIDYIGIVVGTGDTAEDNADYALATQLTEGVGAGNITHGAMDIGTAAVVATNVDMELKRAFTNLTGDTITVKEAGLYCWQLAQMSRRHMLIRDVLSSAVEVPDKCSLTIIYTVRTTV